MKKYVYILIIVIVLILLGISVTNIYIEKQTKQLAKDRNVSIEGAKNGIKIIVESINKKNDIFGLYKEKAIKMLKRLTLEEKIAQLFIVGTSTNSDFEELTKYQFGGYLFFKDFFEGQTQEEIKSKIQRFQKNSKIPLLIAVDEEGGKVVRVSSNQKLAKEPFRSPSELYKQGGLEAIKQDTIQKSILLGNLGINLNFAPVVDIATNSNDYMYKRSLQEGKELTSMYAKTVIQASQGYKVSYTLKHFPGYGRNQDTHVGGSEDERTYEEIYENDLEPFRIGIRQGAEAVMISHNVVISIDKDFPASISKHVHDLLRKDLGFTGIIITDDINMRAIQDKYSIQDAIKEAILASNDMIIISIDKNSTDKLTKTQVNYASIIQSVKDNLEKGEVSQEMIDKAVIRILSWKYYKGLM